MEEDTKDSILMIKKMDWALSTGQMDANFMVIGQTDDNMAGESTI